jgi:GT2 family glycosyltransferase
MYKGKQVNILVPIFNQYGLIPKFLKALDDGTVKPDCVYYFDNGKSINTAREVNVDFQIKVFNPERNLGTAIAWNYMIRNTNEERIILNDDILVNPNLVEEFLNTPGDLVGCSKESGINVFSAFLIRDSCISKVGLFDESISPNYCYFEDNDYAYRMKLLGVEIARANCGAEHYHGGSQSMKALSPSRLQEHHMKFDLAKANYIRKWGGEPYHEGYITPYNKG